MPAKVVRPPNEHYLSGNLSVFLAGPIQDAPDWQAEAISGLVDLPVVISNPRTEGPWHGNFERQVDWETWHLSVANVVLFWLCKPAGPTAEGRSYAQTSRFELGEWFAQAHHLARAKLVVGIEPGFHGERYIRHRIATRPTSGAGQVQVFSSLPETVEEARKLLQEKL